MTTPHQPDGKGTDNGGGHGRGSIGTLQERRASVMMEPRHNHKLGTVSGVYIPVFLNIISILMFLRFGTIIGSIGFMGILGKSNHQVMNASVIY
jgi:potassium/chloride transporter 9